MPEPSPPQDAPASAVDDRLDSWKQIAAYLGRGVTTVQRWEQEEGLPVHRLAHAKKGSVFAYKRELDAWHRGRTLSPAEPVFQDSAPISPPDAPARQSGATPVGRSSRFVAALTVALLLLAISAVSLTWIVRGAGSGAATADPRPIAAEPSSEIEPGLSPDGSKVVYAWNPRGLQYLFVRPVAGGTPASLGVEGGNATWSPRGDLIAYLTWETENVRALHIVPAAGGTPRRLALIGGAALCWPPDGRAIAIVDRNSTTEPFAITTIDLASGERRRLTSPPPGSFGDTGCAFSSDGAQLAVSRFHNRFQSDLYVAPVPETSTSPAQRLTTDFPGIHGLAWTPDDKAVIMGSVGGLWKVNARDASASPELVTGRGMSIRSPSFGTPPGGRPRLAYELMNLDVNLWQWELGTGEPRVVPASPMWEDHPAFSPDGRTLAFASNRTGHNEIWTDAVGGGAPRRVTYHDGPLVLSPRWSPDGQQLAFSSQVAGNRDIYIVGADGSASRRLTFEPSQEDAPSWSRDGRWIYFRSDRAGVGQIWKAPADGGPAIKVTQGEASTAIESEDGRFVYFSRGPHTPGVWAVPVAGGPETLIASDPREGFWDIAQNGLFFLDWSIPKVAIRRLDLRTRELTVLRQWETRILSTPGISVSRDGRHIVWAQRDIEQSDIMLIDPWRAP
jgi:Tol biopolymer transport system component